MPTSSDYILYHHLRYVQRSAISKTNLSDFYKLEFTLLTLPWMVGKKLHPLVFPL